MAAGQVDLFAAEIAADSRITLRNETGQLAKFLQSGMLSGVFTIQPLAKCRKALLR